MSDEGFIYLGDSLGLQVTKHSLFGQHIGHARQCDGLYIWSAGK